MKKSAKIQIQIDAFLPKQFFFPKSKTATLQRQLISSPNIKEINKGEKVLAEGQNMPQFHWFKWIHWERTKGWDIVHSYFHKKIIILVFRQWNIMFSHLPIIPSIPLMYKNYRVVIISKKSILNSKSSI